MPRSRKFANPFYSLLLAAGIAFAMTAMAYCIMAVRESHQAAAQPVLELDEAVHANGEHPLMFWMRQHGETALLIELGLLALFTFAAIGTDDYWQRRQVQTNLKQQIANQR